MSSVSDYKIALVLGGGNALGAYQGGVYQALAEGGIEPAWIVGGSAGAINGAIIAGNPPERRLERLRQFWRPASEEAAAFDWLPANESWRRTSEVVSTLLLGRSDLFAPLGPFGSWWELDASAGSRALYDTAPLARALAELVDFDLLNEGTIRYTATAVDLDSGDDVAFDSAQERIHVDHLRASAALLTAYPAIELDGRLCVDSGLSANLPLDPVLAEPGEGPLLVIAVDLLPLRAPRPGTLGEVAGRLQDLVFAAQTRRTIARWQATYDRDAAPGSVTLVRLAYHDQEPEVAGKAMDFSPRSARYRWDAGLRDARRLVGRLGESDLPLTAPGLHVAALAESPASG